jgi:voltage-gated potassium channel
MIARRLGSAGQRVGVAVAALFAVVAMGTLGYRIIEGWAWFDSLYMTVITVATVGFSEVEPLSEAGRAFTILLIVSGISVQFIALATIVDYLTGGHLVESLEGRRMSRRIENLRGHTIVCGIGRVGSVVARALAEAGCEFIVVDRSDEAAELCQEEGWPVVRGDAADEETLRAAGIERANSVVTAVDSDADNLFVVVTARALNPKLFIVARSSHETSEQKILKAGANRVITPNVIGGRRMAGMVMQPVVSDYLDLVAHGEGVEFRLEEYSVVAGSQLLGRTLSEARVREATGAYVLAVRSADGRIDANPDSGFRFGEGDRVVALGTEQQLGAFAAFASRLAPGT